MVLGFTGTRQGMTAQQVIQLSRVLHLHIEAAQQAHRALELHVGGAQGADTQVAALARACGYRLHVHPCPGVVRPPDETGNDDQWHEVFPPLVRNRHIVEACDLLIAAPRTDDEERRSGTWATIRIAQKLMVPVLLLSRGERARRASDLREPVAHRRFSSEHP